MKQADIVVVGGSAAGLTAAITARRHYPEKKVLIVRREARVPIPCGIPYVFGTVATPEQNLVPDAVLDKHGIDLLIAEATAIDSQAKMLDAAGTQIAYDRLVLATGSGPVEPPIPGVTLDGVFAVRKDVEYLRGMLEQLKTARNVIVIGGGFIGIEIADEINRAGDTTVTVVEIAPHCLSLAYDDEFCVRMEDHVRSRGVTLRTGVRVDRITGGGRAERVALSDGTELPVDVVIVAIGAAPSVELAKTAGLDISPRTGAIVVDRAMRTSQEGVFACGDCADKVSFFGGVPSRLRLASIATSEARIAGANLYGVRRENIGTVGVWSTAVEGLALGTAGMTEAMARNHGYDVVAATVEGPNRHPGIMPGATNTVTKLVFERNSGTIVGGQVMGDVAAGEIINALSACIQSRMTAENIAMFQMGTHPALTASPIVYPIVNAAEMALSQLGR